MSWGVYVLKFDDLPSVEAMFADGFSPLSLGTADEVRARISDSFPTTDWTDSAWGQLDQDGYSIEFPLQGELIEGMTLIVRGGGNPVPVLSQFCLTNGWSAYDIGAEQFLNAADSSASSWREWQAYRDQVVEQK